MTGRKLYTGSTKLVLALDIGTTHSGVSYSLLEHGQAPQVYEVTRFPGQRKGVVRVPSLLYYDVNGRVVVAGSEALADHVSETAAKEGWKKAQWWKLHFSPQYAQQDVDIPLPSGKTAVDVLADFIKYLFLCATTFIQSSHPGVDWSSIQDSIEFVFTHPNGWEGTQRQRYRRAIEYAGLVPNTPDGRSRVRLITECEASLHYYVSNVVPRSNSEGVVIIDAGGGTVDSSVYLVTNKSVSCKEIAPAECHLQGSVFVHHNAGSLLQEKLNDSSCCDLEEIAEMTRKFDQKTGLFINSANGLPYPRNGFPSVDNRESLCDKLELSDQDITGLFSTAVGVIKTTFERQRQATKTDIDTVFIIGGFSTNDSFRDQLQSFFRGKNIEFCYSADHVDKAVSTGAVLSHIDRSPSQPLVISRVARASCSNTCPVFPSAAKDRWEDQKRSEGIQNVNIDKIMDMIGLEHVKEQILNIKGMIDTAMRQGTPIDKECLNLVLVGNPGTGKTTVARLYADFLRSIGALRGKAFVETTGSKLSFEGILGAKALIDKALSNGGGAIFIDEAYQLVSEHDRSGRQVLDFILGEMDGKIGSLVFILAGYADQMEKLVEHNPGFTNRFPYYLRFSDYTHKELIWMLQDHVFKRYNGWMEVEDGIEGLYARIAVRRLVRGSGRRGFGNVRALQNMFTKIRERQAERLEGERKSRMQVEAFLLTKEDLIGPDPSQVLEDNASWKKLQWLIGLKSVKDSVREMFELLVTNYQRELEELEPIQISLNRVFLGSPGTGKTSVAKLYGQILADLGMLSKGEVVVKNPSDFIGDHLGGSEKNTRAILESTRGKVLVIDEAYMLHNKNAGHSNSYNTAVIDTMVSEIQSVPGEDCCVLLLGYKDLMEDMFQNVNPGLARRFAIENAFTFEDFTETQLMQILDLKLKEQHLYVSEEAKCVAREVLSRLKIRPNFGNAGEVDNLLGQAKARYQKRVTSIPASQRRHVTFEPEDFDPDFARGQIASANLDKIFEDVVGCVELKEKLDGYQKIALQMRQSGMDMQDMREITPTNFVFKGPPGTGKTMIARKFGQIYYDMGFLASAEVVECSATDLTGQYVGHTGPKTKGMFEKALGKVLFVDEAYRLSEGAYAKEAMEEIVGLVTNERFMKKVVVILAGYEKEMNTLLATNPGLSSRFSEEIIFPNMTSVQCLELLDQELRKKKIIVPELIQKSSDFYFKMQGAIDHMTTLPSWGNARDVKTLGEKMVRQAYMNKAKLRKLSLSAEDAFRIMEDVLQVQQARKNTGRNSPSSAQAKAVTDSSFPQYTPPRQSSPSRASDSSPPQYSPPRQSSPSNAFGFTPHLQTFRSDLSSVLQRDSYLSSLRITSFDPPPNVPSSGPSSGVQRDAGVSDAVWHRLQADIEVQKTKPRDAEEEETQERIKAMGRCQMGYEWIKQENGYRCAGGSHFISHSELARAAKGISY